VLARARASGKGKGKKGNGEIDSGREREREREKTDGTETMIRYDTTMMVLEFRRCESFRGHVRRSAMRKLTLRDYGAVIVHRNV